MILMQNERKFKSLPVSPPFSGADDEAGFTSRISVLFIEQRLVLVDLFCKALEQGGEMMVDFSFSAEQAIVRMQYISYDVIVTDYNNSDIGGNALLRAIRSTGNTIPFIYFVRFRVPDLEAEAEELGMISCVEKTDVTGKTSFDALSRAIKAAAALSKSRPGLKAPESSADKVRSS
jgi:DNA-binding NtrC family response regulator